MYRIQYIEGVNLKILLHINIKNNLKKNKFQRILSYLIIFFTHENLQIKIIYKRDIYNVYILFAIFISH